MPVRGFILRFTKAGFWQIGEKEESNPLFWQGSRKAEKEGCFLPVPDWQFLTFTKIIRYKQCAVSCIAIGNRKVKLCVRACEISIAVLPSGKAPAKAR